MKFAREMSDKAQSVAEYKTNQLSSLLVELQYRKANGVVSLEAANEYGVAIQRAIVLREGAILYAGPAVPTPREFVIELSAYVKISVIETVLRFAEKRSSIQQLLATMVQIDVLQWSDILQGMRKQAVAVLEELLVSSGTMTLLPPEAAGSFDLCYDAQTSWFTTDTLLLEIALSKTKATAVKLEKEKAPVVPAARISEKLERRPTILIVDDSPIAQALVKRALGKSYRIAACSNAIDALNYLHKDGNVDLMLLDLTMPDMDGLELCRTIRKMERFKGLPIIMLTARDGMVSRVRGHIAGTTDYLAKPIQAAKLVEAVAQYAI